MKKFSVKSLLSRVCRKRLHLIDCGLGKPVCDKELRAYEKLSLRPCAIIPLNIMNMKVTINVDTERILRDFLPQKDGRVDRTIIHTPHFRLYQYYLENGRKKLEQNFRELDYYKLFMRFNEVGYKTNFFTLEKISVHYDDRKIWEKIERALGVFDSIRKNGYLTGIYTGRYISVFEVPLAVSRFHMDVDYEPFELFIGHHRAAALGLLGHKTVPVLLLEDALAKKGT